MEFALLVLYLLEGLIFATVALVLKKKPSKFPNVETGFHVKEAMESEEKWQYANRAAAGVCAAGAVLLMGAGIRPPRRTKPSGFHWLVAMTGP